MEPLTEGMAEMKLSKKTKARIRAPWSKALIVKLYGRSVGFHYLTFKINALWKPMAKMDCVTLRRGFFLIRFSCSDDYDNVLQGGPWFIGENFLAIKPWEPYFKAYEAKLTSMAIWVRLPELPIEFYNASVLKEIGSLIGPVLRIDSYTTSETRGGYARLCVQLDLDKPLISSIWVGRLVQKVLYEGISSLCFCCGKLGHKQENCRLKVRKPNGEDEAQVSLETNKISENVQIEPNYGPWMVITRKKGSVRMGKVSGPTKSDNPSQVKARGNLDLSQASAHVEASANLGLGSDLQPEYGEDFDRADPSAMVWMGHLVQESSGGYSGRDNFANKSGVNEDSGMIRGRAGAGLEASLPYNTEKHQAKEAIHCAPLGRIRVDHSREEACGFQRDGHDTHGKSSNSKIDPNHGSGEDMQCTSELQRGYLGHSEAYDNLETGLGDVQGSFEEDGVEYGGSSEEVEILPLSSTEQEIHASVKEKEYWALKSRLNTATFGDRNTSFFHVSTIVRRHRNKIRCLKDAGGNWLTNEVEIKDYIRNSYKKLYEFELIASSLTSNVSEFFCCFLEENDRVRIDGGVTEEEVIIGLWALKPFKAPGLDGLHVGFYQRFWMVVKNSVCNETAFVPGTRGINNVLIAQELFHALDKKKGKTGLMAMKLDLEKAYDRLKWSFIYRVLQAYHFPPKFSKIIMSCVTSASTSILVNEGALKRFEPSRGIRQGDPLPPYLFILCMEYLGHLIEQKCVNGDWIPLKASKDNLGFSHLLFADDIILFNKADMRGCEAILDVLENFCRESGQKISPDKFRIYFSPNVSDELKEEISERLGIKETNNIGKYLRFPLKH
ncbi:uncharacterized protein LOC142606378 [Castanea sativa]|uniref:uncharacterized protein LOC142606378 n=1 Tax=Castanea sativa TaxID=21020 RepID=UPI003F64F60F